MAGSGETRIRYMDTAEAYDLWSEVYDTDGNFLQALDDIEMRHLLPSFISLITAPRPWRIIDLGCGTGRNTAGILSIKDTQAICLDVSPKMLDLARARITSLLSRYPSVQAPVFSVFDMMDDTLDPPDFATDADGIISTLVVEHVPLRRFCEVVARMLKPDGLLLVTNMHAEMGQISQAGFTDPRTQDKIRPKSYAHTIDDFVQTATEYGLELVEEVKEKTIDKHLAGRLGPRAEKWVGVKVWFGAIFRKARI